MRDRRHLGCGETWGLSVGKRCKPGADLHLFRGSLVGALEQDALPTAGSRAAHLTWF